MACSMQIRWEDCWWRCCSQRAVSSGKAFLPGFFGGALTWAGKSRALVAGVHLSADLGMGLQQVFDAFGADRGHVVHAAGPERAQPQQPALTVTDRRGLDGVLLLLARHERPPPLAG